MECIIFLFAKRHVSTFLVPNRLQMQIVFSSNKVFYQKNQKETAKNIATTRRTKQFFLQKVVLAGSEKRKGYPLTRPTKHWIWIAQIRKQRKPLQPILYMTYKNHLVFPLMALSALGTTIAK